MRVYGTHNTHTIVVVETTTVAVHAAWNGLRVIGNVSPGTHGLEAVEIEARGSPISRLLPPFC